MISRCIVNDLSEYRRRQLISNDEVTSTGTLCSPSDPWNYPESVSDATHKRRPQVSTEDDTRSEGVETGLRSPCHWIWLCFICHSIRKVLCRSASVENTNAGCLEESACLIDCDELGLTWEEHEVHVT